MAEAMKGHDSQGEGWQSSALTGAVIPPWLSVSNTKVSEAVRGAWLCHEPNVFKYFGVFRIWVGVGLVVGGAMQGCCPCGRTTRREPLP